MSDAATGRPSLYTDEIADEVVQRISKGETLRAICRDDHMPCWTTIYSWMHKNQNLSERISRARELGYDAIAEQCFDIADETQFDSANGKPNKEWMARSKLRVDTRLKLLAKWSPKKYGDSTTIKGDKDNPIGQTNATDQILGMLTLDQLEDVRIKIIERDNG